jgi:hypothetical protein
MSLALGIPHRLRVSTTPEGRWLAELARRLFGPRGPKLTMAEDRAARAHGASPRPSGGSRPSARTRSGSRRMRTPSKGWCNQPTRTSRPSLRSGSADAGAVGQLGSSRAPNGLNVGWNRELACVRKFPSPRAAGEGAAKPRGWGQGVKDPKCLRLRGRRAKRGGRGARPCERAHLPLSPTLSPLSRGEGIGQRPGVATAGFHG